MTDMIRDLRHVLRSFGARPGFTAVVVLTLAVGIGANAVVFSVMDALVLRPFPVPDIDRLVMLWETNPKLGVERGMVAPANFLDWQEKEEVLDASVAFAWWDVNITGGDQPERLQGTHVSPGFLQIMGVTPVLGRTLSTSGSSAERATAIISHRLWSRRFAADRAIIGKTLTLNGEPYSVVGVAPAGFEYPYGSEIWAPLYLGPEEASRRDNYYLEVVGRMRDGVTVEDVQARMDVVAHGLEQEHPATNAGRGVRVMALARALVDEGAPALSALWQTTVAFVLFIACVNVANLMLARGADREKELALRLSLGASRPRLVGQLMTESLLLALLGAVASLPLAWLGIDVLRSQMPAHIARFVVGWDQIDLDLRVVAVIAAVSVGTAFVFGFLPAVAASRLELSESLKEGGRGGSGTERRRARSLLVIAEVALALVLLVASGLSIRGTLRTLETDQGYDPEGIMTTRIALPERKYAGGSQQRRFYRDVLERIRALPGVVSADMVNVLPAAGGNTTRRFEVEGGPVQSFSQLPVADFRVISGGYFDTMRIPVLRGRAFGSEDGEDAVPVAIVSKTMARRFWPGGDALAKRFRVAEEGAPWLTVVGVAGDVIQDWFLGAPRATFYRPFEQEPRLDTRLVVRTSGEPTAITSAVRGEVRNVDPDQPIFDTRSMRQILSDRAIGPKYLAVVMGVFGALALVLSALGTYGVIAYSVSRRTREIGLRVALGASRTRVLQLILGRVLQLAVLGVGIGLLIAAAVGQVMAANLFGIVSVDRMTYVVFSLVLMGTSLAAGYIPARKALAVHPARALRVE